MKYEEYEALINDAVKNPDNATTTLQAVLAGVKEDTTTIASYVEQVADLDKRVKDLQNTNIKLFLAQTGKKDEEQEEKSAYELLLDELHNR